MFKLDDRLTRDTADVGNLPLCKVLLMNDNQYPWLILVPRVENAEEIFHLNEQQRIQLEAESTFIAKQMHQIHSPDKMNVAALGNIVSQLHIHHVARYKTDIAWPKPVWGAESPQIYSEKELKHSLELYRDIISVFKQH